jgi:hypothetical protein
MYESVKTAAECILEDHNTMHPKIQYKMDVKINQLINFLYLTIHRKINEIVLGICRKPTQTDITIPNSSNHPKSYKMATFNNLLHRVNMLTITSEEKYKKIKNRTNGQE